MHLRQRSLLATEHSKWPGGSLLLWATDDMEKQQLNHEIRVIGVIRGSFLALADPLRQLVAETSQEPMFFPRNSTHSANSIGWRRGGREMKKVLDIRVVLAFRQFLALAEGVGDA